jgi:hypothetical protein
MAGRQTLRPRGGRFVAGLVICLLTFAGRAPAQYPSPPPPPAAMPAPSLAEMVDSVADPEEMPPQLAPRGPSYYPGPGGAPTAPRVVMGPFDTIIESLFGQPDPDTWKPLTLGTLFSEGWNEAWVPSPNGSGGAPRQGWINATDGNFYRLWFFTFAQAFNQGSKSNSYLGAYTLYTPLSRRLLLITNIPFVVRNASESGQPIVNPNVRTAPMSKNQSTFGDMSFTPRILLHETQDFSLTAEVAVLVPTGRQPLEGKTALTPAVGFWYNPFGRWVIRGGIGDLIPLNSHGKDALISQLAIGQTLTDHDVRFFGDFTWYVSAVVDTPSPKVNITA